MAGYLEAIGTEPRLVGLATLGGLISLAMVVVSAMLWLHSRRWLVGLPLARRRLEKARRIAGEFRLARRGRQLGLSTASLLGTDIRLVSIEVAGILFNLATMVLNAGFAWQSNVNAIAMVAGLVIVGGLSVSICRRADRAVAKIRYADAPAIFWREARHHVRLTRRSRP